MDFAELKQQATNKVIDLNYELNKCHDVYRLVHLMERFAHDFNAIEEFGRDSIRELEGRG